MKKTMIFIILFVLLSSFVCATTPHFGIGENARFYASFTGNATDQVNNLSGTVSNAVLTTDRNGASNSAYDFGPTTPDSDIDYGDASGQYDMNSAISMGGWIYYNTSRTCPASECWAIAKFSPDNPSDQRHYGLIIDKATGKVRVLIGQGTNPSVYSGEECSVQNVTLNDTWTHVVATYNNSNNDCEIYINGGRHNFTTSGTGSMMADSSAKLCIGCYFNPGRTNEFGGKLDEMFITNDVLNATEIEKLYLFGDINGTSQAVDINITLGTPVNNDATNTATINYSYTPIINNGTPTGCSLWTNSTGVWQLNTSNSSEILNNTLNHFNNSVLQDSTIIWNINCTSSAGISSFADNNFTLTKDTVDPVQDATSFVNLSVFVKNNLTGQFNFSDENILNSINITIDNSIVVFNKTNVSSSTFVFNMSYNLSAIGGGNHTLNVRFADAHTAKKLQDIDSYKPKNGLFNDYMQFDFEEPYSKSYIKIYQKDSSIFDDWQAEPLEDKYSFKFKPATKKTSYIFNIESDKKIYIYDKPNTKYKQWIVFDDHWLDFMPYTKVKIKQITPYQVEVTIKDVDPNQEEFVFESVGDLNIVTINYTFTVANAVETFTSSLPNNIATNMILNIYNTSETPTVVLEWNSTNYTVSPSINNASQKTYNQEITPGFLLNATNNTIVVPHRWWINFSATQDFTDEQTQSVFNVGLDDCTTFNATSLNFTLRKESDRNLTFGDMRFAFNLTLNESTFNFSVGKTNVSSVAFCIFPAGQNITLEMQAEFIDTGFDLHTYFLPNQTVNNVTKFFTFYLQNGTTITTFNVQDEAANDLENVFIKILKYDVNLNSFITTEILKTDFRGEAIGNIVQDTFWYKFIIERNGLILQETQPTKISSSPITFRVNLVSDFYDRYTIVRGISSSLVFNNATSNFRFTFSDSTSSVNEGCLRVENITNGRTTLINETCVTSSASTILVNVGNTSGLDRTNYKATSFIKYSDAEQFMLDVLNIDFSNDFKVYGEEGVFVSFMLIIVLATVAVFSPIAAVGLTLFGLIAVTAIGFYHLSLQWIIALVILGGLATYRLSQN